MCDKILKKAAERAIDQTATVNIKNTDQFCIIRLQPASFRIDPKLLEINAQLIDMNQVEINRQTLVYPHRRFS